MENKAIYHKDIATLLSQIPEDSVLSRSVHKDEKTDITLFSFAKGQELTEHTSSHAAIIQVLSGQAAINLGGEKVEGLSGSWIYMPPGLPHSLKAVTNFTMLLTLIK